MVGCFGEGERDEEFGWVFLGHFFSTLSRQFRRSKPGKETREERRNFLGGVMSRWDKSTRMRQAISRKCISLYL